MRVSIFSKKSKSRSNTSEALDLLHSTPLLDSVWYRQGFTDPLDSPIDMARHYLERGATEGRNPHPLFHTNFYLSQITDLPSGKFNPLVDYIMRGAEEGRSPHPLFDPEWYREQGYADQGANSDPLSHYLNTGWKDGYSPNRLFDPKFYVALNPSAADVNPLLHYASGHSHEMRRTHILFDPVWYAQQERAAAEASEPLLTHYLVEGWKNRRSPHPLFDAGWYLDKYPDVAHAGINPLLHYLRFGWRENRNPHPLFDGKWYLQRNREVARAGINPLSHYCETGWREGRSPHALFDAQWYLDQNPDVERAGIEPLQHYVTAGSREGRSPSPLFDSGWYLGRYPDVAAAGLDPLRHYLSSGWTENRDPSPFFNTAWYRSTYSSPEIEFECPLVHYLSSSEPNVQKPNPIFDAVRYDLCYARNVRDYANPLVDYVAKGIEKGRTPIRAYGRLVDLLAPEATTPRQAARLVFERALAMGQNKQIENICAARRKRALDGHFEIWRAPGTLEGKRVCLFAAYAPDGYIPRSSLWLLRALRREGLAVVCIAATNNSGRPYGDAEIECDGLVSRENFGYDFASWALGLQVMPSIWKARSIVFANDSVFGPITQAALKRLLDRVEETDADYIGLTESWQVRHHFQSYFFALKARALLHPEVRSFWTDMRCVENRDEAIRRFEVRMLETLSGLGLTCQALFPLRGGDSEKNVNPTLDRWRELLDEDFPFVKVQTLRDDIEGVDKSSWRSRLAVNPDLLSIVAERLEGRLERNRAASIARPGR